jgi:pimeloyl-ACP methyl ester carboxylesterase
MSTIRAPLTSLLERTARAALRRQGYDTRDIPTAHGRMHVYDSRGSGHAPTTVFLHGIGSAATPFAPLFARVRARAKRVVAPDLLGHGFSDEPRGRFTPAVLYASTTEALDAVLDEPAIVVGNSLGGSVALQYAIARPERVRALVLLSPAGARATDAEWSEMRAAFDVNNRRDARAFVDRIYHRTPLLARVIAHEIPASLRRRAIRELLETATNDDAPTPEQLGALPMPIVLIWGRSERLLPPRFLEYFREHLPTHAVVEQPEAMGHCPHFDAPERIAQRIHDLARDL